MIKIENALKTCVLLIAAVLGLYGVVRVDPPSAAITRVASVERRTHAFSEPNVSRKVGYGGVRGRPPQTAMVSLHTRGLGGGALTVTGQG